MKRHRFSVDKLLRQPRSTHMEISENFWGSVNDSARRVSPKPGRVDTSTFGERP